MARTARPGKSRRRAAQPAPNRTLIYVGIAVLAVVAFFVYGGLQQQARQEALAEALAGVEEFPSEGAQHVPAGTPVEYNTDPPTSGPHYGNTADPGFHTDPVAPGLLVHNLEHGHVIIYYDPERTPQDALDYVRSLTERYRGAWDAVLAVPRADERYALILTAWRHMLRLETFDQARVDAFVDRFRGRGPENPIR